MSAASHDACVIGLDLGGTKVLGVIMDKKGNVRHQLRVPTPQGGNAAICEVILETLTSLLNLAEKTSTEIAGISIGVPGYVDSSRGVILDASNIDVKNLALGSVVRKRFSLPTLLVHDVKAAALGEAHFGAGVGVPYLAYLNVGTGISVGLILDGSVYQGMAGRAGEIGHVVMQRGGAFCSCGRRGCLETLASGPALVRRAQKLVTQMPDSLLAKLAGEREVSAEVIAQAAGQADPAALGIVHTAADYLGQAVAGLVNVLDIQRVVVGGGLAQMGAVLFEPLRAAVAAYVLEEYRTILEVVPSKLGVTAGAVGAATALHQELKRGVEAA